MKLREKRFVTVLLVILASVFASSCSQKPDSSAEELPTRYIHEKDFTDESILQTEMFDAGFNEGDGNWRCVFAASDGKIYYVICCHRIDTHAQMYSMDPTTKKVEHIADLGEVLGEKGKMFVPQGKVHVKFFELDKKLYFATHMGYYKPAGSTIEAPGIAKGYQPYQGGHFLSYDLNTGEFKDLGKAPMEEGIVTMNMDKERKRLYGLTWPGGHFLTYDIDSAILENHGPVMGKGERGTKEDGDWNLICRTFGIDTRDGNVYWSDVFGTIQVYDYGTETIEVVQECDLNNEAFGEPNEWRSMVWSAKEKVFYGIRWKSDLFRFDPAARRVDPLGRIFGEEEWSTPSLGLQIGPDGDTIYCLVDGPGLITVDGRKLKRTIRFVTYHIPTGTVKEHGTLRLADGRYPVYATSIEVHDGMVYSGAWIDVPENSKRASLLPTVEKAGPFPNTEMNLIRFRDPFIR